MTNLVLPVLAGLMVTAAVLVLGLSVASHQSRAAVRRSLDLVVRSSQARPGMPQAGERPVDGLAREMLTAASRALVPPVSQRWIRHQLERAGRLAPEDLQRVLDWKLALGATGLALGSVVVALVGVWGWLVLVLAVALGYFAPDLLAYNAGLRRSEDIRLALPDALDLLDLCVSSGLSLQAAMAKVVQVQRGAVAEEFARVLQEMRLGVARADALTALVERVTQSDLKQLVGAILQAESLGIPIAAVLREQASEMRARRGARARETAQKVPVKILGPVVLCFLPGLFIIILGPAAISVFEWFTG